LAYGCANFVDQNGHGLVNHHLRWFLQTIFGAWLHRNPKNRRVDKCACDEENCHSGMGVEVIGLDYQSRPGLTKVALNGDGDQIAPFQTAHPSARISDSSNKSSSPSSAKSASAARCD
jgi:hypothetical protein